MFHFTNQREVHKAQKEAVRYKKAFEDVLQELKVSLDENTKLKNKDKTLEIKIQKFSKEENLSLIRNAGIFIKYLDNLLVSTVNGFTIANDEKKFPEIKGRISALTEARAYFLNIEKTGKTNDKD